MITSSPRLIRLVARRYRELQGLVTISDAMFPLLLGAGLFIFHSDTAVLWYGAGIVVCFLFSLVWLRRRIHAYYTERFGRTGGAAYPMCVVMLQGLTAGSMLTDIHVSAAARVPIVFLLLGGWPAWIAARDWPYRWHWSIPVVVAAAAAFPLSSRPVDGGQFVMATCWVAAGGALAIAGALDHRLLVRTLRPGQEEHEAREHA